MIDNLGAQGTPTQLVSHSRLSGLASFNRILLTTTAPQAPRRRKQGTESGGKEHLREGSKKGNSVRFSQKLMRDTTGKKRGGPLAGLYCVTFFPPRLIN